MAPDDSDSDEDDDWYDESEGYFASGEKRNVDFDYDDEETRMNIYEGEVDD
jgi:hypothetical protein